MKKFRFKYSPTVWILLAVVLILSIVGLLWNVLNLVEYSFLGALKIVTYSLIIFMNAVLTALVLGIMLCGRYVVKGKVLITRFGFFTSKTSISDICQITHFKKSDKLVVYFNDAKYSVIVISPNEYEKFAVTIRNINRAIIYSTSNEDEKSPE